MCYWNFLFWVQNTTFDKPSVLHYNYYTIRLRVKHVQVCPSRPTTSHPHPHTHPKIRTYIQKGIKLKTLTVSSRVLSLYDNTQCAGFLCLAHKMDPHSSYWFWGGPLRALRRRGKEVHLPLQVWWKPLAVLQQVVIQLTKMTSRTIWSYFPSFNSDFISFYFPSEWWKAKL